MNRIFPLLLCLLCAPLAGCPSQNTAAALVGVAGSAIASLEVIEGHTEAAVKIQADFNAAQNAVLQWKTGTPTEDVAQALQLVESDLNLMPVSQQDQAYVALAVSTVQSVLDLFPAASAARVEVAAAAPAVVAPRSATEFKARWNALPGRLVALR